MRRPLRLQLLSPASIQCLPHGSHRPQPLQLWDPRPNLVLNPSGEAEVARLEDDEVAVKAIRREELDEVDPEVKVPRGVVVKARRWRGRVPKEVAVEAARRAAVEVSRRTAVEAEALAENTVVERSLCAN